MTAQLQSGTGSLCTAPINSKGGDSWWTSLLLASKERCRASQKSKEENSWRKWQMQSECVWYASLAQLWLRCFLLSFLTTTTTTTTLSMESQELKIQHNSKWCNLWLCSGAPQPHLHLHSTAELNYTILGNKKKKPTHLCSKTHIKANRNPWILRVEFSSDSAQDVDRTSFQMFRFFCPLNQSTISQSVVGHGQMKNKGSGSGCFSQNVCLMWIFIFIILLLLW